VSAGPTASDRDTARAVLGLFPGSRLAGSQARTVDRVADALAAERERVRAPFLTLAAYLEDGPPAERVIADRIRRAAQEDR
jgi:hypothetical protein